MEWNIVLIPTNKDMWNGRAPGSNGTVIWNGKGELVARVKSEATSEYVIQERKIENPRNSSKHVDRSTKTR